MQETRVVKITGRGGPETLSVETRTIRDPGPGEVRVAVRAAGLNRADSLQRKGFYPAPAGAPADVPGLEFAGEIDAVGDSVLGARVGDRVMGICAGGGMATHLIAHERELVPIPANLDFTEAAAIPEVFFTAFDALMVQAAIGPGGVVLCHVVGSGIGTAAVQLVRAVSGRSIGTSRSQAKLDRSLAFGLDHGVLVTDGGFADAVRAHAANGVDAILDTVGASYLEQNVESLATGGTIVTIGLLGGAKGTLALGTLLAKRGVVRGSTLRARPLEEKATLAQRIRRELIPLFERGLLRPVIDEVMPMERIREAHERLDANETFGKLVLTW
jgi:NADPH2:quinone reductase